MNPVQKIAEENHVSEREMCMRLLKNLCFPIHAEMTYDRKPFDIREFFSRCEEIWPLLPFIDLDLYQEEITSMLHTNPSRNISYPLAYQIYGRVWFLQALCIAKLDAQS